MAFLRYPYKSEIYQVYTGIIHRFSYDSVIVYHLVGTTNKQLVADYFQVLCNEM